MNNKIKFGLKNVHIAIQTYSQATGLYSYGTPVALPGAVNLSMEAEGDASPFYADDIVYFRTVMNNGYRGSLEIALVPDWFRQNILQETLDTNGVLVENAKVVDPVYFAMLFEFEGDKKAVRHCMYNCSVTRPSVSSQTKEASITPVTETLNLSADPRTDGLVKVKTGENTDASIYQNWYGSVYEPDASLEVAKLTALAIGSLTLTPVFDGDTFAYTTETTNESDAIAVTGASGTTIAIRVNGNVVADGATPTWNTGNNSVIVTVSRTGQATSTYAITVVKTAGDS